MVDLAVQLGPLSFRNPILVASGTFGYAHEMAHVVDFTKLGGIVPKTVTRHPRIGNRTPRTIETPSGMLNSIGLDNDGIEHFLEHHLPYLKSLPTAVIGNVAGESEEDFVALAEKMASLPGLVAVELNLSCPNVSGGIDFAIEPKLTERTIRRVKQACKLPIIAKLTPNVTDIVSIAQAAAAGGADALSLINTYIGMAIDWRKRQPILGNKMGGLSGPAIKPLALRIVWAVRQKTEIPIIGIGGISNINDVMEFLVAGANAVQIGTANFFDPTISEKLVEQLPFALQEFGANSVQEIIGCIHQ